MTQTLAIDHEARAAAAEAGHKADLAQQAWTHHTEQCERDRQQTLTSLRDMGSEINQVRSESQERGRRVHEKMEALREDVRRDLKQLPNEIAAVLTPSDEKTMVAKVQNWVFSGIIGILLSFIAYLLFLPNPFVAPIAGGG